MPKTKKNKTEKVMHPYSRKAMKEERRLLHKHRVDHGRQERSSRLDILAEKLQWFHDRLDDRTSYTKTDLLEMIDQFRHRFDEELDQIAIVHSVGARKTNKQHAARLAAINFTTDMEKDEFESMGIEVPDLMNKDNLFNFRLWDGEMKYVQNFKMKKISVRDQEKQKTVDASQVSEKVEEDADTEHATTSASDLT